MTCSGKVGVGLVDGSVNGLEQVGAGLHVDQLRGLAKRLERQRPLPYHAWNASHNGFCDRPRGREVLVPPRCCPKALQGLRPTDSDRPISPPCSGQLCRTRFAADFAATQLRPRFVAVWLESVPDQTAGAMPAPAPHHETAPESYAQPHRADGHASAVPELATGKCSEVSLSFRTT